MTLGAPMAPEGASLWEPSLAGSITSSRGRRMASQPFWCPRHSGKKQWLPSFRVTAGSEVTFLRVLIAWLAQMLLFLLCPMWLQGRALHTQSGSHKAFLCIAFIGFRRRRQANYSWILDVSVRKMPFSPFRSQAPDSHRWLSTRCLFPSASQPLNPCSLLQRVL